VGSGGRWSTNCCAGTSNASTPVVHPIGITYDATTGDVWVAVYSGQILVLADRKPG
jgi:hypothetical protein